MATVENAQAPQQSFDAAAGEPYLGFIGGGRMAGAILRVLLHDNEISADRIVVCEKSAARRTDLQLSFPGLLVNDDVLATARLSRKLLLAIKPQDAPAVLTTLQPHLTRQHLVISIVAGLKCAAIRRIAGNAPCILRVMPNLPILAREGMSVYCAEAEVPAEYLEYLDQIFGYTGALLQLPEAQFDAVTALSGSGPAFVAYLAEAMCEAALEWGLDIETARLLISQTVIGTGAYLQASDSAPEEMIADVCSPGGTTEAGMQVLRDSPFKEIIVKTVQAAARRSAELSSDGS